MDDTALTDAALAAFADAMPGEAVVSVETITRGWDSLALLVNGRWLLRVARRAEVSVTLAREARLLPVIAAAVAPDAVPRFTLARLDMEPAVVGYEAIRGQPLTPAILRWSEARVAALADRLASFLSALHAIPAERAVAAGLPDASAADWRAEYMDFRDWSRAEVAPRLPEAARAALERLWAAYLDGPDTFSFQPVVIHRDLAPEHVLLSDDGALAGVIDWGDVALGDPAMDFAGFLHDLGEGFARQVIARWRGPRAARETGASLLSRARLYARLAPLHSIRFGLLTGQEAYIQQGAGDLARQVSAPGQP